MKARPVRTSAGPSPRTIAEITAAAGRLLSRIEEGLSAQLGSFDRDLAGIVTSVLTQKGKRLRPLLVLLSGEAGGGAGEEHIRLGILLEMIHAATLLHDDVLDGAALRHALPTAERRWGSSPAVLLGDVLFAHALEMAASFPTTEVCRMVAAAAKKTCTGEILQTEHRGNMDLSRGEYLRMIEMKTAALFEVSCFLGVRLSRENRRENAELLGAYGRHLGVAYQIYDDCVDLFGREEDAGKSLGTDLANGKLTLPAILMIESASDPQEAGRFREELARETDPARRVVWAERLRAAGIDRRCGLVFRERIDAARRALAEADGRMDTADLSALADVLENLGLSLLRGSRIDPANER